MIANRQTDQKEKYQVFMDIATENAVPIHQARAGEINEIGDGVRLEILNPPDREAVAQRHPQSPIPDSKLDNDQSVALRLVYGEFSVLLTGDASEIAEREMLASGRSLSAVVYKAGHHGARSSSGASFLRAVNPQYVVVSAGEENNYGHPHEEVLERVADVGAAVLRTNELGTIEVVTDGKQISWESWQ